MIDIVYPIKRGGSASDDWELRYSLRSVAANLHMPLGDLYIFGHRPAWLQECVHIQMDDKTGDKANNLREKYRRMAQTTTLSDPFILLDDDHMLLQPWDDIPFHTKGDLGALVKEYRNRSHGVYLRAALYALNKQRLRTVNYQIHFPMLIHKPLLRGTIAIMTQPMVMGSIYGNLRDGEHVEIEKDYRVNTPEDFEVLKHGPFLSLPPIPKPDMKAWIENLFPEASRWETGAAAPQALEVVA